MLEQYSIDIFNNSKIILEKEETKFYIKYIFTIFLILCLLIVSIITYKYNRIFEFSGIVKDGYIKSYIPALYMKKLQNNKVLVNNKEYELLIVNVSEELVDTNYINYYEVTITIKGLKKKEMIDNKIINMSLILEKTTLLNQILKNIEKGLEKQ